MDRPVALSSPVEQAIRQIRRLHQRVRNIEGSDGSQFVTELSAALRLLESSADRSPDVDWSTEIKELNIDDEIGAWLKSTLTKNQIDGSFRRGFTSATDQDGSAASPAASPPPASPVPSRRQPRLSREKYEPPDSPFVPVRARAPRLSWNCRARDGDPLQSPDLTVVHGIERQLVPSEPGLVLARAIEAASSSWANDVIELESAASGHVLLFLGEYLFERHGLVEACHLDRPKLRAFLLELEGRYGIGRYHTQIHGADVMLTSHLFITKFGLVERLTKLQLFALLLGAVVHDFNHPGTSNAHEVKMRSKLAMIYSDQSVLEHHHLASAFTVILSAGTDILSGLESDEYAEVRSLIIETVMHTDLAKHFDFIARLKTLASSKGYAAHAEAAQKTLSRGQTDSGSGIGLARRKSDVGHTHNKGGCPSQEETGGSSGPILPGGRRRSFSHLRRPVENLSDVSAAAASPSWKSLFQTEEVDARLLVITAVKFADLGHSFKPFPLHELWTMRITHEFWEMGDREREVGVPISPLCDREKDRDVPQSQMGFFQFVCIPFFRVVADLLDPEMEPYLQLLANFKEWQDRRSRAKLGSPAAAQ